MDETSYTPQPPPPTAGRSNTWLWIAGSLLVILCALLCVAGIPIAMFKQTSDQLAHSQATSTAFVMATQTSEAALTQPPADWQKVVGDVFLSNNGSWNLSPDTGSGVDVERSIADGHYVFHVVRLSRNWYYFAEPSVVQSRSIDQIFLAVDARQLGGSTGDNNYGLIFRHVDEDNYTLFEVQDNGYAAVETLDHSNWDTNIPWTREPSIKPGEFNHLVVVTDHSGYQFLINNHLFGRVNTLPIIKATAGMFIYGRSSRGVSYEFDNLQIYVPPQ